MKKITFFALYLSLYYGCNNQNLYQRNASKNKGVSSRISKLLDDGKVNEAYLALTEQFSPEIRAQLENDNLTTELLEKLKQEDVKDLNILINILALKSGVDIVSVALEVEKSKKNSGDSDMIIKTLLPLFSGNRGDIKRIRFARSLKEAINSGSEADSIYVATLTTAEVLFYLKSFDSDGDFEISPSEMEKVDFESVEELFNLTQKLIRDSSSIKVLMENNQVKKVIKKFEDLNTKIDTVLQNGSKEKIKVLVKGIFNEFKNKEAKIEYTPPEEVVEKPPESLPIIESTKAGITERMVQSMIIFGDSIAVGVGVAYKKGQSLTMKDLAYHPGIEEAMGSPLKTGDSPDSDQKIIESFDSAYSATAASLELCRKDLTEPSCFSHSARLKVKFLKNFAKSGSKIHDILNEQIPLFEASKSHADYIVINTGGNDFCSNNYEAQKFKEDYKKVLGALYNLESKPYILLVKPPNVIQAFSALQDSDPAFSAKDEGLGVEMPFTCGDIRWMFCPRALANRKNLDSQKGVLDSILSGIDEAATETEPASTEAKRIIISDSVYHMDITEEIMGIDCFHPNQSGYKKIADLTFPAVESILKPYEH